MNVHCLADLFPPLPESELVALADNIKTNGLRDPIACLNGEIVDGRNRLRACEIAGVAPRFEELGAPATLRKLRDDVDTLIAMLEAADA